MMEECQRLKNVLLIERMQANIDGLIDLVKADWDHCDRPNKHKVQIYPICLQENQLMDLERYL